ncbi:hypothetical protein ACWD4G_18325 [Streptomyces sp. NPDC002643]
MKRSVVNPVKRICIAGLLAVAALGLTTPTASTSSHSTAGCVYDPANGGRCSIVEPPA